MRSSSSCGHCQLNFSFFFNVSLQFKYLVDACGAERISLLHNSLCLSSKEGQDKWECGKQRCKRRMNYTQSVHAYFKHFFLFSILAVSCCLILTGHREHRAKNLPCAVSTAAVRRVTLLSNNSELQNRFSLLFCDFMIKCDTCVLLLRLRGTAAYPRLFV